MSTAGLPLSRSETITSSSFGALSELAVSPALSVVRVCEVDHPIWEYIQADIDGLYPPLDNHAPRMYLSPVDLSLEDTHVHTVISYAIKCIFGSEELLRLQWWEEKSCTISYSCTLYIDAILLYRANGRMSNEEEPAIGKFTFVQIRSSRHELAVGEFKSVKGRCSGPPSDLVKMGQEIKVMLNNLIKEGILSPVVCGILVEGNVWNGASTLTTRPIPFFFLIPTFFLIGKTCATMKMDLSAPRFYRMVMLNSFPLCTSRSELSLLPNMLVQFTPLKVANRPEL
ncbi:hypothetical protein [Absidia glauca]|uniref:Uncharacterized protein n=1 Tax=Absidia glauca TaxID=4829 RepID=A0A168TBY0_ABSGL|nr:hypothetical protein [Absidia glauca]